MIWVRLAVSVVFGIAGFAKLLDGRLSEQAFGSIGVPTALAKRASQIVSAGELLVAIGLVWPRTVALASRVALAMLASFSSAIVINLLRGRDADCGCFGRWSNDSVGSHVLVRNAVLAVMTIATLLNAKQKDS